MSGSPSLYLLGIQSQCPSLSLASEEEVEKEQSAERGLSSWPRAAAPLGARGWHLARSPGVHVAGPAACGREGPGLPGVDLKGCRPGRGGLRGHRQGGNG